ncbi:MAG: S8 family peptidase [Anaerolineae bacterium]
MSQKGLSFLLLTLLLLSPALVNNAGPSRPAPQVWAGEGGFMPGRVLVKFKGGVPQDRAVASLARRGLRVVGEIPQLGVMALAVPQGQELAILEDLGRDPLVAYAELDHMARALGTPNDPRWPEQWNMALIRADLAWEVVTDTRSIVIALLDTGLDLDHPDLRARVWTNPGEVPGNGLDDDGNGKVDDVHGWHFYQVCSYSGCWPGENNNVQDEDGHGTHVAGIAAAEANNGIGVAGLAWGAALMPVKVMEDTYIGAWYFDIAAGMVYAADNGAAIINLSLGGEEPGQTLEEAVAYAHQRGVLVVAAAGNDDGPILYPAAYAPVLAVGATDPSDQRAGFSNYGPQLDVMAPGVDILSTWPRVGGYFRRTGTSMAAPHVAGLAALVWAADPHLTPDQVATVIQFTAIDLGDPGPDEYHGYGRIDAYAAVVSASSPTPTATPTATPTVAPTPEVTPAPGGLKRYLPLVVSGSAGLKPPR